MHHGPTPRGDRAPSQQLLRALLDLTRLSRQTEARDTLEGKTQALLHYLLACCQASRGALVLMDSPRHTGGAARILALARMQAEEVRALLACGSGEKEPANQVSAELHWLLVRLPLFQAEMVEALAPARPAATASPLAGLLPTSVSLIVGWSPEIGQQPELALAARGTLIAQLGDTLSVVIMHLLLMDALLQRQAFVTAPVQAHASADTGEEDNSAVLV